MLIAAQNRSSSSTAPRVRSRVDQLVQLAEALQAPVVDRLGRMNFPTNHYLWSQLPVAWEADLILALDVGDLFDVVGDVRTSRTVDDHAHQTRHEGHLDRRRAERPASQLPDKQRFYQPDYPVAGDSKQH